MSHIGRSHAGEQIGTVARKYLQSLLRGICLTEDCGHLRIFGAPTCPRCRGRSLIRPLVNGDAVVLSAAARATEGLSAEQGPETDVIPEAVPTLGARPVLPVDFEARVSRLSSITRLETPPSCRLRLLEIAIAAASGFIYAVKQSLQPLLCLVLLLGKNGCLVERFNRVFE